MLQVKTFRLPQDEDKANEFLAAHLPAGQISFNNDLMFVGWDDGTMPVAYQLTKLQELLSTLAPPMASKTRQSLFGGLFALSLKFRGTSSFHAAPLLARI